MAAATSRCTGHRLHLLASCAFLALLLVRPAAADVAAVRTGAAGEWYAEDGDVAAYALRNGERTMESFFAFEKRLAEGVDVSIYGVFDGTNGEEVAQFVKTELVQSLHKKIVELKALISGARRSTKGWQKEGTTPPPPPVKLAPVVMTTKRPGQTSPDDYITRTRAGFAADEAAAAAEEGTDEGTEAQDERKRAKAKPRSRGRLDEEEEGQVAEGVACEVVLGRTQAAAEVDIGAYVRNGLIDYYKLLSDEMATMDDTIAAKVPRKAEFVGTTALLGIKDGNQLTVMNVGDSRAVMHRGGNAEKSVALTVDHSPENADERRRVESAGGKFSKAAPGLPTRINNVMTTTRVLGVLDQKSVVTQRPDIVTYDLGQLNPEFLIFASEGVWKGLTNAQATAQIRRSIQLKEDLLGAKNLAADAKAKGSVNSLVVLVVKLGEIRLPD